MKNPPSFRFGAALVTATAAGLLLLSGCDRSPSDMPPPTSSTPTQTPSATPSPADTIPASPSSAPLAPPGTPGPAAPTEGAPSGGPTGK